MPPRSQPLPEAATESAREARKSFFCEMCQKGYARMTDFEAHENSYDHQHRKRLKEMRQMTRDPNAAAKARLAEERANEEAGLRAISSSTTFSRSEAGGAAGTGQGTGEKKKRPVFKSTLQPHNAVAVTGKSVEIDEAKAAAPVAAAPTPSQSRSTAAAVARSASLEDTEKLNASPSVGTGSERGIWDFEEEHGDGTDYQSEGLKLHGSERYQPMNGPTELRDIRFVDGRVEVI